MFNRYWPDLSAGMRPSEAVQNLTDRAAELSLEIQQQRNEDEDDDNSDQFEHVDNDDDRDSEGPVTYHESEFKGEDIDLDRARSEGVSASMANAGHGQMPVSEDDPEAYEDESFDPLEEDWSDVKEVEEIKDKTFCFECWATQTADEQEINQDLQDNKKLETDTLGKMSELKRALTRQADYNENIRPHHEYLKDKPVALENWRDHSSKHTINPDAIEERSLRFLCSVRRHLEETTMKRPKKRKASQDNGRVTNKRSKGDEKIDVDKLNLWLKIEAPIKRLMNEQRRRLSTQI